MLKSLTLLFCCTCFLLGILPISSCDTEGVKLSRDDRYRIDTLTNRQTIDLSNELDKICKDSSPIFKQHFIDSLLIVREQEALMRF